MAHSSPAARPHQLHPGWEQLRQWLARCGKDLSPQKLLVEPRLQPGAGYGLFASTQTPPSTPVFTVPACALLNTKTLSPCYPATRPKLSATQLISLHLFLHQPDSDGNSSDPLFGPYISVLPHSFESHPLTRLVKQSRGSFARNTGIELLDMLPRSVAADLKILAKRFYDDWKRVSNYLQEQPSILAETQWSNFHPTSSGGSETSQTEKSYIWSWLNVNTRCIYHRIKSSRSDPDNMTLCPILDFANHTSEATFMTPRQSQDDPLHVAPAKLGGNFTLLSPANSTILQGSELHLKYGAHANRKLFVEYGFVEYISQEAVLNGFKAYCEVDVQQIMEQLFNGRGDLGTWMENCLKTEGYWGDWTMHSSPPPAHPSFRLITALRLYRCISISVTQVPPDIEDIVQSWRDTILGKRDIVSAENEASWRETLRELCEDISNDARFAISRLESELFDAQDEENGSVNVMKESIETLWREELYVAMAVSESVRQGVQF